jgi:allophanate hydrolase
MNAHQPEVNTRQAPTARVAAAYARIAEADRPEVWITLREEAAVTADAAAVE